MTQLSVFYELIRPFQRRAFLDLHMFPVLLLVKISAFVYTTGSVERFIYALCIEPAGRLGFTQVTRSGSKVSRVKVFSILAP